MMGILLVIHLSYWENEGLVSVAADILGKNPEISKTDLFDQAQKGALPLHRRRDAKKVKKIRHEWLYTRAHALITETRVNQEKLIPLECQKKRDFDVQAIEVVIEAVEAMLDILKRAVREALDQKKVIKDS
jgi:hypothetical protein